MAQLSIQFIYRYKPLISLRALKGGILMRISEDQYAHKVKDIKRWATKISRVKKAHKDDFEEQLSDGINERKTKVKTNNKKETQKEHQALVVESQELDEDKQTIVNIFQVGLNPHHQNSFLINISFIPEEIETPLILSFDNFGA